MDYSQPFTTTTNENRNLAITQASQQTQTRKKLKLRDQDWEAIFSAWRKSDLSQAEFCRQQRIEKSAFYYRQKKR